MIWVMAVSHPINPPIADNTYLSNCLLFADFLNNRSSSLSFEPKFEHQEFRPIAQNVSVTIPKPVLKTWHDDSVGLMGRTRSS
ncbi:MAG: hypothetical protein U7126_19735 [Microcoleus sp.]